jgi:hypothetical protein
MNLRDGVVSVRNKLGEGKPWLFDNNDIIRDLNLSARALCSKAQAIRATWAKATTLNANLGVYDQEYQMPADVEFPYGGKIQIGILYPLIFKPQEVLQTGGYVSSTPLMAYLRRGIILTQQMPGDTGQTILPPVNPQGTGSWIIGLYPVPSNVFNFWVDYVAYHPWMKEPLDPCLLPDTGEYFDAWTDYAVAKGKEKEGDLASSEWFMQRHEAGKQKFADYMLSIQTIVTPPFYGNDYNPFWSNGPTVRVIPPTAADLGIA